MHVMAACEKRRSGLAPSTTQGPGTKTESSLFGMPNHQTPRATSPSRPLVVWTVAACLLGRCGRAGAGLLTTYLATHKTKTKKKQDAYLQRSQHSNRPGGGGLLTAQAALVANWMMPALDRRERDESGMVSSPSSRTKRPGK